MVNSPDMIWVLLRGLAREQQHWGNFPQLLQSTFPAATIITPDLPGSGVHHAQTCPVTIKNIVDFVRHDMAIETRNKPVHIIGLSMGGMVALEWLRQYPEECAAAVLINTSLRGLSPFYQRLQPRIYTTLINSLFINKNVRVREKDIFDLTSNLNSDREYILNNWVRYATEHPVTKLNALRQLTAAIRYKMPAHKPLQPMLILNGLGDRMVNPQCSKDLAQHWNIALQSHATAGHDLPLDDGEWVCERIVEWLQQQ